ncbi:hypothetical protein HHI36_015225 [Cryptolaemus montrouzieri]|uniref:Uncharacterized protein n=1 Tax=Cryptolaemus montrouzieri TaxID=559131 RepID=A0ABD2N590_9CUCU
MHKFSLRFGHFHQMSGTWKEGFNLVSGIINQERRSPSKNYTRIGKTPASSVRLHTSDLFDSVTSMAPNSENSLRIEKYQIIEDTISKEKQRPPIYNPEDYALSLKKWGKKSPNGCGVSLYSNPAAVDSAGTRTVGHSFRDYRNPMLISSGSEMTLRQFGTVSELLNKLKSDLRLAYPSYTDQVAKL